MIYIVIVYLVAVAFWVLFSKTNSQPWEAKKQLHWLPLTLSVVAGLVGGNTFVTFTGFSYKYGPAALVYFVGVFLGLLVFHLFNEKVRGMAQSSLGAGLVYTNYPKSTQSIFTLANFIRFFSVSLIQVIAGSTLLNQISGIDYTVCTFIIVVTIGLYTFRHGFSGVIKTDIIQMALVIAPLLVIIFYYYLAMKPASSAIPVEHAQLSISRAILFGLFGFLLVVGSLDIWQRYARLKSNLDSRRSLLISIISLAISGFGILTISTIIHSYFTNITNQDTVFVKIFTGVALPSSLEWPLAIAILSAILSTADTFIHGAAMLAVKGLSFGKSEAFSQKRYRVSLICLSAVLILTANIYPKILSIAVFFANIVFAFSPFMLLLLIGRKPAHTYVNIGLIVSLLFAVFVGLYPGVKIDYSYGTLLLSSIFMCLGLFVKSKD